MLNNLSVKLASLGVTVCALMLAMILLLFMEMMLMPPRILLPSPSPTSLPLLSSAPTRARRPFDGVVLQGGWGAL